MSPGRGPGRSSPSRPGSGTTTPTLDRPSGSPRAARTTPCPRARTWPISLAAADAGRAQLGESQLIGVLCAWQRLISWAQAGQAATVTTLARRRDAQARELDRPALSEHVSDEMAAALRLTGRSASRLLDTAAGLQRLPGVLAALNQGEIDWAKACLFTDLLAGLPDDDAAKIADDLLGPRRRHDLRAAARRPDPRDPGPRS